MQAMFVAGKRIWRLSVCTALGIVGSPFAAAQVPAESSMMKPAEAGSDSFSALGTPQQLAAERRTLRLLDHPTVKAAMIDLYNELQTRTFFYSMQGAPELLDHAITQWTTTVLLRELAGDPTNPQILWEFSDTPRSWHGLRFPGGSGMGDNPDHIYRTTFIDGNHRYEITGRAPKKRTIQFNFQAVYGTPGMNVRETLAAQPFDVGNNIKMLIDSDIDIAEDGGFRIQVGGPAPKGGHNYLPTVPGVMEIQVRDIVQDWSTKPVYAEIRRIGADPSLPILTDDEIAERVVEDLPGFVNFWLDATENIFSRLAINSVQGPTPRDGGWGYGALSHFLLKPGQVLVVVLDPQAAKYASLQTNDPWMGTPDGTRHLTSLNLLQVSFNPDGTVTYVVSPEDPGTANWIDTAGMREGYLVFRWQAIPADAGIEADKLIREFKVVDLRDIRSGAVPAGPTKSSEQRRRQLAERARSYAQLLTD